METVLYVEIDTLGIIFLMILLFGFRQNKADAFRKDQSLFEGMLFSNMLILLFDIGSCLANGKSFVGATVLSMFCSCMFYMSTPLLGTFFLMYCDVKLGVSEEKRKKHIPFYFIAFIANAVISVLSLFFPLIYSFDASNHYMRGQFFFIALILSYAPAIAAFVEVIISLKKAPKEQRRDRGYLLLFILPPAIGGGLQLITSDMPVIWLSTVISLLLLFITIQNSEISKDSLTGVFERGQLLPYIKWKAPKSVQNGKRLFVILLDLDEFKRINDRYGHLSGDAALKTTADVLRHSCQKGDFVARYGGDEFVIVAEREKFESVDGTIEAINRALREVNETGEFSFPISIAAGYEELLENADAEAVISAADSRMYEAKRLKKELPTPKNAQTE